MAKKTSNRTSGMNGVIRTCTYFALVLAAAIFLFNGIVTKLEISGLSHLTWVFNLIGQILLVIGIAFPAYDFTCGKHRAWRIIFWISLVVYVFGCVFGVI